MDNENCDCGGGCSYTGAFFAQGPVVNCTSRGDLQFVGDGRVFLVWAYYSLGGQLYKCKGHSHNYWCTPGPVAAQGWRQSCSIGKERQQLPLQLPGSIVAAWHFIMSLASIRNTPSL